MNSECLIKIVFKYFSLKSIRIHHMNSYYELKISINNIGAHFALVAMIEI